MLAADDEIMGGLRALGHAEEVTADVADEAEEEVLLTQPLEPE